MQQTIRRRLIDIEGKIVRKSKRTIFKISRNIYQLLHLNDLWIKANNAPVILIM